MTSCWHWSFWSVQSSCCFFRSCRLFLSFQLSCDLLNVTDIWYRFYSLHNSSENYVNWVPATNCSPSLCCRLSCLDYVHYTVRESRTNFQWSSKSFQTSWKNLHQSYECGWLAVAEWGKLQRLRVSMMCQSVQGETCRDLQSLMNVQNRMGGWWWWWEGGGRGGGRGGGGRGGLHATLVPCSTQTKWMKGRFYAASSHEVVKATGITIPFTTDVNVPNLPRRESTPVGWGRRWGRGGGDYQ